VSGRVWVALAAVLVAVVGLVVASQALASGFDRWNAAALRGIVSIRTGWLTTLMVGVNTVLASPWTVGSCGWARWWPWWGCGAGGTWASSSAASL